MNNKAIRVAYINASNEDRRLRLELHAQYGGYRWLNATDKQWIDSHDIKSVSEAMQTLYAWYDNSSTGWRLSVGNRDQYSIR